MSEGARPGGPDDGAAGRISVIGPGRVGQSLAAALSEAGRPVTVRGRRSRRPSFLEAHPEVRYRAGDPPDGGPEEARDAASGGPGDAPADRHGPATLVFCVPDDALAGVAEAWAGAPGPRAAAPDGADPPPGGVALHTSGVHGADVLAPLRDAGRAVASWHPLTALPAPRADAFRGVTFGVEGDEAAARRARALAEAVGGRSLRLEAGSSARYHAAAVFASNHLVACLAVAARELSEATGGQGSPDDLLPLARAAVDNLSAEGLAAGATGPLTRGDVGTVRRHLRALPPESADLYRRLARELLDVVEGRLEGPTAGELRRILEGPAGEGGGRDG